MKIRFFPWPWFSMVVAGLLMCSVHAEEAPSLLTMMSDIESSYYKRGGELAKQTQELKEKLEAAGEKPPAELLEEWSNFQIEAKKQESELQAIRNFLSRNVELKNPSPVASDENYQKLHRFHYLKNILDVGDFWVKEGIGRYSDQEKMKSGWAKNKAEYMEEKEALGKEKFIQAGEVTWQTHQKKEKGQTVVEVQGRSQSRALRKALGGEESVLDKIKKWKELSPEERKEVVVSQ